MTDPEHQILALHLQNLHELIRTVDLRLRASRRPWASWRETGRIQPLGRLSPGQDAIRQARRQGFLARSSEWSIAGPSEGAGGPQGSE